MWLDRQDSENTKRVTRASYFPGVYSRGVIFPTFCGAGKEDPKNERLGSSMSEFVRASNFNKALFACVKVPVDSLS